MSILDKIAGQKLMAAGFAVLLSYPLSVILARFDVVHFRDSFLMMIVAALVSFIILVITVFKFTQESKEPARPLLLAVVFTLLPLFILGSQIIKAQKSAFIHDISTDTNMPPEFVAAKADRLSSDHNVDYEGQALASIQQNAYPNIKPLFVNADIASVMNAAKSLMAENNWQVLASNNQTQPFTIEAVHSSLLFAFKDDVILRLQTTDTGTRIDMRSMSRQGKNDLGMNAQRIAEFLIQLEHRLQEK